ncbi:Fc receptor-like protein 1 isoform X3 [Suricata suricatta]|uniref:Fc receptor-like protein 1 isoform X3 n=1 Tax=Suricata suricatta TaxID=37032 RepID=UPI00115539C9|nr:Fc receptor-like protein 1 isoform X3 [Suricata suricatta]
MLLGLMLLMCAPPFELTALRLMARPSRPVEGSSLTLTCSSTPAPSRQLDVPLEFCFFRDGRALWPGWSRSPELLLPTVWREDSGSYWCEGNTMASKVTRSLRVQIQVQRVPVCNVSLETQPPGGQVQKGERLALVCQAAQGTGDITFFWYKGALGLSLQTKTQRSLAAKFEIPAVSDGDSDRYYCAADNGHGPSLSELVSVTVRIPVSRPVLTIRAPGAQAEEGDVLELRCEAPRGSPPILYRFYHKNVTLGRSSAPSGGGVSFNLSLTAEHSGNYSCEADNGLGARRSEAVPLRVTVLTEDRKELLASGILEGLLGVLGPTILALCCYGLKRRLVSPWRRNTVRNPSPADQPPGRRPPGSPRRSPPSPVPSVSSYVNSPAPPQGQSVYGNVNVVSGEEVYSLVYRTQQDRPPPAHIFCPAVPPPRTRVQDQVSQNPPLSFLLAHLSFFSTQLLKLLKLWPLWKTKTFPWPISSLICPHSGTETFGCSNKASLHKGILEARVDVSFGSRHVDDL